MDLVVRKPEQITPNNFNELYVSYGAFSDISGWHAPGFRHQQQSGITSYHPDWQYEQGVALNMIMLEVRPVSGGNDPLYLNDPCYYLNNPGNAGGSGGGGYYT